MTRSVRC